MGLGHCMARRLVLVLCWSGVTAVARGAVGVDGPWRDAYEVYQPRIEVHSVVDGDADALNYNHGSAIAWFRDRWFCLWNANQARNEGKPGQLIYASTSRDGRTWSVPEPAFASPENSVDVVPCPRGVQWQPNLIVVGEELWAAWSQLSRDEHYGCYLSRLAAPAGKWRSRRLLWEGHPDAEVDGQRWRVFPLSGPVRLRRGRALVPVTLLGRRAEDAPESLKGWHALVKRSSVLYSDDRGETWQVSPGAIRPGCSWGQWEPTVWEQSDGTVTMFARNESAGKASEDALLWSESGDGGETWTPHRRVPIRTAVSRMHVVAGPGDRFLMAHNDWPACGLMGRRFNLALFLARGAGTDFVAGPGFSGVEPVVGYPCVWRHGDDAFVSYSAGHPPRSIKVARISPLPSPGRHYLFPRTNTRPGPAPLPAPGFYRFSGHQVLIGREILDPGRRGFSAGAWVMASGTVLLDTRRANPLGGFVWALKRTRPLVCLFTPEHELMPGLRLPWHEWSYVGITVDDGMGEVTFFVNGESEVVPFTGPCPHPLRGTYPHIGAKSLPGSMLTGLDGVLRALTVYPSAVFGRAEHNWLRNQFAASIGQETVAPEREPEATPALWFDGSDPEAVARGFRVPVAPRLGVETCETDGRRALRFIGECSAGVDLDENRRARGDRVEFAFRFRLESGAKHVLCTVGDADVPARVVASDGRVWLTCGEERREAGVALPDGWTSVQVEQSGRTTGLRVHGGSVASIAHAPAATWLYLGEGFPPNGVPDSNRFVVDLASVRSRVTPGGRR